MKPVPANALPAHQARPMDPKERAGLPSLSRRPDVPGKGFLTLEGNEAGRWVLPPERMNGDDPMTEIRYYPFVPKLDKEGWARMSEEARRQWSRDLSGSELGTAWSQELAVALIERARRDAGDVPVEQRMAQVGFTVRNRVGEGNAQTTVYERKGPGGFFSCFVNEQRVWLTFQQEGKTCWHNLFILRRADEVHSGEGFLPVRWPGEVADPMRAMAAMVEVAVAHWEARAAKPRRTAKPR